MDNPAAGLSNIQAIKKFFGSGEYGRHIENQELIIFIKDKDALEELGALCRKELVK